MESKQEVHGAAFKVKMLLIPGKSGSLWPRPSASSFCSGGSSQSCFCFWLPDLLPGSFHRRPISSGLHWKNRVKSLTTGGWDDEQAGLLSVAGGSSVWCYWWQPDQNTVVTERLVAPDGQPSTNSATGWFSTLHLQTTFYFWALMFFAFTTLIWLLQ